MQQYARMLVETDKAFVDPNERRLRLLEFATFNDLVEAGGTWLSEITPL